SEPPGCVVLGPSTLRRADCIRSPAAGQRPPPDLWSEAPRLAAAGHRARLAARASPPPCLAPPTALGTARRVPVARSRRARRPQVAALHSERPLRNLGRTARRHPCRPEVRKHRTERSQG